MCAGDVVRRRKAPLEPARCASVEGPANGIEPGIRPEGRRVRRKRGVEPRQKLASQRWPDPLHLAEPWICGMIPKRLSHFAEDFTLFLPVAEVGPADDRDGAERFT